jgi:hypothetical protein
MSSKRGSRFFHWDNAPKHIAATVPEVFGGKGVKTFYNPPSSPGFAPTDYFLFIRVKSELEGFTLAAGAFKNNLEGVVRTMCKEEFIAAFCR